MHSSNVSFSTNTYTVLMQDRPVGRQEESFLVFHNCTVSLFHNCTVDVVKILNVGIDQSEAKDVTYVVHKPRLS
jgi:hypothetical protein